MGDVTFLPRKRDTETYDALVDDHMRACTADIFNCCAMAGRAILRGSNTHLRTLEALIEVHAYHEKYLPRHGADTERLVVYGECGDFETVDRMILAMKRSPALDGSQPGDAAQVARYVLNDTVDALKTICERAFGQAESIEQIKRCYNQPAELMATIDKAIRQLYNGKSGAFLNDCINARLERIGLRLAAPAFPPPIRAVGKPLMRIV